MLTRSSRTDVPGSSGVRLLQRPHDVEQQRLLAAPAPVDGRLADTRGAGDALDGEVGDRGALLQQLQHALDDGALDAPRCAGGPDAVRAPRSARASGYPASPPSPVSLPVIAVPRFNGPRPPGVSPLSCSGGPAPVRPPPVCRAGTRPRPARRAGRRPRRRAPSHASRARKASLAGIGQRPGPRAESGRQRRASPRSTRPRRAGRRPAAAAPQVSSMPPGSAAESTEPSTATPRAPPTCRKVLLTRGAGTGLLTRQRLHDGRRVAGGMMCAIAGAHARRRRPPAPRSASYGSNSSERRQPGRDQQHAGRADGPGAEPVDDEPGARREDQLGDGQRQHQQAGLQRPSSRARSACRRRRRRSRPSARRRRARWRRPRRRRPGS